MRRSYYAGWLVLAALSAAGCAQRMTRSAGRAHPATAVALNARRQILNAADAGEGDGIANQLRRRMAADPLDVAPRLELAAHYASRGLPELQLEHLRLAVERFPNSRGAHLALAAVLRSSGQAAAAAELLDRFTRSNVADAELLNELGISYDEAGDWQAGEAAFRRAVALAPRTDYLRNNLGYNLLEQQRVEEAIAEFRQALKANPDSMFARNNLGAALAKNALTTGKGIGEALDNFQNAVDSATAYNNLAAIMIEQSRYDYSRKLLESALDYNRSNAAALANLRLVSELDGKPAEISLHRPKRSRGPVALLKRIFVKSETLRSSSWERSAVTHKGDTK
jgi:Flp pilus assembly protein TadD